MPRHHVTKKPEYRFTVVDHTIYTWAVLDRSTMKKVEDDKGIIEYRDSMSARQAAEDLNINPPE